MAMINVNESSSSDIATRTEGGDAIYCEASCQPEDVFYQGSEDEDYEDTNTRRQRYEAAGKRFLNGNVPLLLSATLRGPFDQESGWVNPWRSKNRTPNTSPAATTSVPSVEPQSIANHRSPPLDSEQAAETHLPSPESLKQAPYTEVHPFLKQRELALVQKWRKTIAPSSPAEIAVQTAESRVGASHKKRKMDDSSWLKSDTIKKRRIGSISCDGEHSTVSRRSRTLPLDLNRGSPKRVPSIHGSFNSLPEFLRPPTEGDKAQADAGERDGDDELNTISATSFQSASASPSRRLSPKRKFGQATGYHSKLSDDELSPTKRAAATLSSPVSQKGKAQTCRNRMKASRAAPNVELPNHIARERSSSPLSNVGSSRLSLSDVDMMDAQGALSEEDRVLETQEDNSFAYKVIRPKPPSITKTDGEAGSTNHDTDESDETGSTGSSSPEEGESGCETNIQDDTTPSVLQTRGTVNVLETNLHSSDTAKGDDYTSDQNTTDVKNIASDEPELQIRVESKEGETINEEGRDNLTEDEAELVSQQLNIATKAINEQAPACYSSQISLVERPALRKQETDCPADHSASQPDLVGRAVPSESQRTSRSEPVNAMEYRDLSTEQQTPSQEKELTGFSLRSILTRCVTPLRRLSGLSVQPSFQPQSSVNTRACDTELVESACDNEAQGEGDAKPSHHESKEEAKNTDAESGPQPLVESVNKECSQSPSSHSLQSTGSSSVVPSGSTTAELDLNHSLAPETPQKITTISQQSPWVGPLSSQHAQMVDNATPGYDIRKNENESAAAAAAPAVPMEAQSPWVSGAKSPFILKSRSLEAPDIADASRPSGETAVGTVESSSAGVASKPQPLTQAESMRPSTPEPQFSVTAFASFMTPSPERRFRHLKREPGSQLPSTRKILASVMKNPWRNTTSSKRVSWAEFQPEQESPCRANQSSSRSLLLSTMHKKVRSGSPPPTTPLSKMSISDDMRFRGHFTAIANRSGQIVQRLLPTTSQQILYSPEPQAMAEKFLAADDVAMPEPLDTTTLEETEVPVEPEEQEEQEEAVDPVDSTDPADDTQDPMDIVEDIFNEMGDFLQTFDVDAELDEARKSDKPGGTLGLGIEAQSPW
ncbi:hypothetical protein PT974_00062 [Cladobotryum mycophilum]|uniref:Protamine P1 n=1 Tax=Cladobotryum mycophilum TaxID=491253 RepID=A0ABR0SZR4_9HYPO